MEKKSFKKAFTFNGKRYYVYGKTENEAILKCMQKKKELEEGTYIIQNSISLKDWIEQCAEVYKRPTVTEKRYKDFMSVVRNGILIPMGHMKLSQIRPLHCQQCINLKAGKSKFLIAQTKHAMDYFFNLAVQNNLIAKNPAENISLPLGTVSKRRALTSKEKEAFLAVAFRPQFRVFLLMYYCGCRSSEACNLQGLDIIEKDGYNLLHIRGTKSAAADRYVPIPDVLYEAIKDTPKFSPVAPNLHGNKHTQNSYKRASNALKKAMNLQMGCKTYRNELIPPFPLADDFVPYCLRHTYCTELRDKGIDIRTAQYLMGHSDIKMTANVYTHADESTAISVAEKLQSNLNGVVQGVVQDNVTIEI